MQVVFPLHPGIVVAPGKVVAHESGIGIVSKTEATRALNVNGLDGFTVGRLKDVDPQIGHAGYVGRGTPMSDLSRETEAEVVHHPHTYDVSLMDQEVLRGDGGTVRISQDISRVEHRIAVKVRPVVAQLEPVVGAQGMVYFADNLVGITMVRPAERHLAYGDERQQLDRRRIGDRGSGRRRGQGPGVRCSIAAETRALVSS